MPKEQKPEKQFNPEEFVQKALKAVMTKEWGSAILAQADTIKIEVVRIDNSNDIMLRISGQKPGNSLKLTTVRHIDNFLDLVNMIANNEGNLADKLNALKSVLREDGYKTNIIL